MESATQQAPNKDAEDADSKNIPLTYASFWIRMLAAVLDSILLLMVMVPLLMVF